MNLSLPYFRTRRYLTGIDWIVGAMNHDARKSHGAGAISQAILDLGGRLEEGELRGAIDLVSTRFPLIQGKVARDWFNLAPYWKVPRASPAKLPLRVIDLAPQADDQAQLLLTEHVNQPLANETEHLRFLLVRLGDTRSRLGMVFDHRLLDAHGAESVLRLIDLAWRGKLEEVAPKVRVTEPAHLDQWSRRFESGKLLNRMFYKIRKEEVSALAMPKAGAQRPVRFVHASLTKAETDAFVERVAEEISMPIVLPSAAARAVLALRKVLPRMPLAGTQCLLFTTITLRQPQEEWESLFFNPFAFLIFTTPDLPAQGMPQMALDFRDQLFELMRQGVPAAMLEASALGRIFPLPIISRVAREIGKGRLCSLYFACIKETGFNQQSFLGLNVANLVHTPLAFCPPGLNLCMTTFDGRFNLVLAYVEGTLDETQATGIMREFKASLLSP